MAVASRVQHHASPMLAITPCRDGISDRFPHAAFIVRVPPNRWFEIAVATDPRLLLPAHRGARRAENFATSRGEGLLRAPGGAATYFVSPAQLRRFVGARRLYYAVASYLTPAGDDPVLTPDAHELARGVPWIRIGGDFTGRTLPHVAAARPAISVRYGGAAAPVLAWGGDAALSRSFDVDAGADEGSAPLSTTCWTQPSSNSVTTMAMALDAARARHAPPPRPHARPSRGLSRGLDLGISAFPSRYADPWTADARLQRALDAALADLRANFPTAGARRLPIALVALSDDGANKFAANLPDDLDFIASLGKVSAMYAAFELRRAVDAVARAGTWSTADELWRLLNAELDPQIANAVATIPVHGTPRFREIFDLAAATPGGGVDFSSAYRGWLQGMIGDGENHPSSQCITRLGFQYINGALAAGGLYDAAAHAGLWLTGDFVSTPLRLADTKNDQLVGQAGTPRAVAKLFTLLSQGRIQGVTVSEEMTALLHASVAHSTPWIMREPDISVAGEAARGVSFDVSENKLGVAPLKAANGGHSVYSEASILHRGSRWFVVAWQNFLYGADGFRPIARLVDRAIEDFLRP